MSDDDRTARGTPPARSRSRNFGLIAARPFIRQRMIAQLTEQDPSTRRAVLHAIEVYLRSSGEHPTEPVPITSADAIAAVGDEVLDIVAGLDALDLATASPADVAEVADRGQLRLAAVVALLTCA